MSSNKVLILFSVRTYQHNSCFFSFLHCLEEDASTVSSAHLSLPSVPATLDDDWSLTSAEFSDTCADDLVEKPRDLLEEYLSNLEADDEMEDTELPFMYDVYDFKKHPLTQNIDQHYNMQRPLQKSTDESVVMWETKRPLLALPDFCSVTLDSKESCVEFVASLKAFLHEITPFDEAHSAFWKWLEQEATQEQVQQIHVHICKKLPRANGHVATHSPAMLFATGSHNNPIPLGSMGQAKSAMFYLIPYQGKSKFPIQQSLNVLNRALGHIEKYKTTSKKGDKGTLQRTAKHLLARTYHQMHIMMELSDYQVAAALLELPSMIMSDTFQYGNPLSLDAFHTFIEMQEMDENYMDRLYDEMANRLERAKKAGSRPLTSFYPPETATAHADANDDWSEGSFIVPDSDDDSTVTAAAEEDDGAAPAPTCNSDNVLQSLGHVTKVNLPLQTKAEGGDNSRSILVPTAALYLYRARPEDILANLNYYEYLACIMFMNKPASPATVTDAKNAQQYELSPDFAGCTDCRHQLKIKQSTPLLIGRAPPHPGPKPEGVPVFCKPFQNWEVKANAYARYYLLLFRPETFSDHLSYTWRDLEDWVEQLHHDSSILSKFRLMIMDRHMKGLAVSRLTKEMINNHRFRARDLWTNDEKQTYRMHQALHRREPMGSTMDEMLDEAYGEALPRQSLKSISEQLRHDIQQKEALKEMFEGTSHSHPPHRNIKKMASFLCPQAVAHVIKKASDMYEWECKPEQKSQHGETPTGSDSNIGRILKFNNIRASLVKDRTPQQARQQLQVYDLYAEHFKDPAANPPPPPAVLVHGGPGVGKSHVRDAVAQASAADGRFNLKTAFNAINAAAMRGQTTAYLIALKPKLHMVRLGNYKEQVIADLKREGFDTRGMIFIEEVSTEAPWHVAQLCHLCQLCNGNFEEDFGGRRVFYTGDFTQLGPVRAISITKAIMNAHADEFIQNWLNSRKKVRSRKKNHCCHRNLTTRTASSQTTHSRLGSTCSPVQDGLNSPSNKGPSKMKNTQPTLARPSGANGSHWMTSKATTPGCPMGTSTKWNGSLHPVLLPPTGNADP